MGKPLPPLDFETISEGIRALNRTIAECDAETTIGRCDDLHARLSGVLHERRRAGKLSEGDLRLIVMAISALRVVIETGSGGCRLGIVTTPADAQN